VTVAEQLAFDEAAASDDGSGGTGRLIGVVVVAILVLGLGLGAYGRSRRAP
jgi:hypothetical protein